VILFQGGRHNFLPPADFRLEYVRRRRIYFALKFAGGEFLAGDNISRHRQQLASRKPPTTAAAARLPPDSLTQAQTVLILLE